MIDTVTNLTEILRVPNTMTTKAAHSFEMGWLFKYPQPVWVIVHDQGTEFMGEDFQALLRQWEFQTPHLLEYATLKLMPCVKECIRWYLTICEPYLILTLQHRK